MKMKNMGAVVALLTAFRLYAAEPPAPPPAQKILGVFRELREAEARPPAARRQVSITLTDGEINDYMRYALRATPRPGLESVTVKLLPHNYVSTFAVIDFDAVERWKPGAIPTWLKPFLHGKQTISVDYQFTAVNSKISFSVQRAYYDKLRLPAFFVEMMIGIVAARQPEHYDTSKPLPLPFSLRQVWTESRLVKCAN
jgi:hypothetical protein